MVVNISCKFEKASYNIFLVRAVTVKSLYTPRRWRRNEAKSIVLVDIINNLNDCSTNLSYEHPSGNYRK